MEILLILLFLWFLPVVVLCAMADSKGRSKHFGWWAVFLGWLGFLIAAIMIAAASGRVDGGGHHWLILTTACRNRCTERKKCLPARPVRHSRNADSGKIQATSNWRRP